jgi:hypothetical protein
MIHVVELFPNKLKDLSSIPSIAKRKKKKKLSCIKPDINH